MILMVISICCRIPLLTFLFFLFRRPTSTKLTVKTAKIFKNNMAT